MLLAGVGGGASASARFHPTRPHAQKAGRAREGREGALVRARHPNLAAERPHLGEQGFAAQGIEVGRNFVEQNEGRDAAQGRDG